MGKETAAKLYALGADTIILCRDSAKGQATIDEIRQRIKGPVKLTNQLTFRNLDLTSLESVEKCSTNLKKELEKVDILVNNAGVMAVPTRELTKDGFEKHIGINHLGTHCSAGLIAYE